MLVDIQYGFSKTSSDTLRLKLDLHEICQTYTLVLLCTNMLFQTGTKTTNTNIQKIYINNTVVNGRPHHRLVWEKHPKHP